MSRHLGEEIAVLDGLDGFDGLGDGRIGTHPAAVAQYARRVSHNYQTRKNVIDASEGGNYSGGSSYAEGLPLMPSSVGLAAADSDLINYSMVTNVLPPRKNVIDPSGGANYSGGSSYAPGIPLVTSGDAGLAALMARESYDDFAQLDPTIPTIRGGYGRAGLGAAGPMMDGGYGKGGLGRYKGYDTWSDFDGLALGAVDGTVGSSLEIEDGRIGRTPASGSVGSANRVSHNFETRRNVIDASEGANYSGGSSYAPGLPLMPSSVGLAELSMVDALDAVPDAAMVRRVASMAQQQAFFRAAAKSKVQKLKGQITKIAKGYATMSPARRAAAQSKLVNLGTKLKRVRSIRRGIMQPPRPTAAHPQARGPYVQPRTQFPTYGAMPAAARMAAMRAASPVAVQMARQAAMRAARAAIPSLQIPTRLSARQAAMQAARAAFSR